MQLSRLFFYSFLLSGLSNYGVLADVSDAEQNLYAINSALSGIAQQLEALPSHSFTSEAGLVRIALSYPRQFLTFSAESPLVNSKPDGYVVIIHSICCCMSIFRM